MRAIAEFFQTGRAPVDPAETIEVFEFMTAAQLSKDRGGAEVPLQETAEIGDGNMLSGFATSPIEDVPPIAAVCGAW